MLIDRPTVARIHADLVILRSTIFLRNTDETVGYNKKSISFVHDLKLKRFDFSRRGAYYVTPSRIKYSLPVVMII